jgi:hypothetical protein
MTPVVQNLIVLSIVAAAAGWLAYRAYATFARKRKAGCGACANCPAENAPTEPQVISVDALLAPLLGRETTREKGS